MNYFYLTIYILLVSVSTRLDGAHTKEEFQNKQEVEIDTRFNEPLVAAAFRGDLSGVEELLKNKKGNVNGVDKTGFPAVVAAVKAHVPTQQKIAILNQLLQHGADISKKRINFDLNQELAEYTPLMEAAELNDAPLVRFLLEKGANPYLSGTSAEGGSINFFDLIQNKPDLASLVHFERLQTTAHKKGLQDVFQKAFEANLGELNEKVIRPSLTNIQEFVRPSRSQEELNKGLSHALLTLGSTGDFTGVLNLISQGADVNIVTEAGDIPLISAIMLNREDVVAKILEKKALVNIRYDHRTPLMLAAQKGNLRIVEMLLKAGANPLLRDLSGYSARKYAQLQMAGGSKSQRSSLEAVMARLRDAEKVYMAAQLSASPQHIFDAMAKKSGQENQASGFGQDVGDMISKYL